MIICRSFESYTYAVQIRNKFPFCNKLTKKKIIVIQMKSKNHRTYVKPQKDELRKRLTDIQYEVTQHGATEFPYDNIYYDEFRPGLYVDITTGEPLFSSADKFNSGCGWPAFTKPISDDCVSEYEDNSLGIMRTEVRSRVGDSHLGHVFQDGPSERGGLRYCINSASLQFIPKEKMQDEGYEAYIPLIENQ